MKIEIAQGRFNVDAEDLAPLLGVPASEVPGLIRAGRITGVVEEGRDADAGRFRITFRHGATRVRFTLDSEGNVLGRSRVEGRPHP